MMNLHLAIACDYDYIENPLIKTVIDEIMLEAEFSPDTIKDLLVSPGIGVNFSLDQLNQFDFQEGSEYQWKKI